jgi:hypothetical protein
MAAKIQATTIAFVASTSIGNLGAIPFPFKIQAGRSGTGDAHDPHMRKPTPMRRDNHRSGRLVRRDGVWYLEGRPIEPGDLVEVRRARVGEEIVGEDWIPAVVGADGNAVELEDPTDFVPGSRASALRAAGLRTLQLDQAEIRRARTD